MIVDAMTGSCLYGTVTFHTRDVETDIHACHCSKCRTWSGTPALGVSVGSVEFIGTEHIGVYGSSPWAERRFCKSCGTHGCE